MLEYGRQRFRHGALRRWVTRGFVTLGLAAGVLLAVAARLAWPWYGDARAVDAARRLGGVVKTRQLEPDWLGRRLPARLDFLLTRADDISLRMVKPGDADIATFAGLTHVRDLDLYTTDVSDASLLMIREMRSVEALHLGRTRVTDDAVRLVKDMPNLTYLGFQGANVGDAALVHIAELPKLNVLVLAETQVTDAGLSRLHACPHLTALYLDKSRVSAKGVEELRRAIPGIYISWEAPRPPARGD
jgi:hypothetical protein